MKTMCCQEFIYLIMRLYCHFSQVPVSQVLAIPDQTEGGN